MVQVVSMLEAASKLGSVSFQSKEVRGAQNSEFLFYKTGEWERSGTRQTHTERVHDGREENKEKGQRDGIGENWTREKD